MLLFSSYFCKRINKEVKGDYDAKKKKNTKQTKNIVA